MVALPGPAVIEVMVGGDGLVTFVKPAVTDFAASIVTTQLPVPVQAPLQPANTCPAAGLAVSFNTAPL